MKRLFDILRKDYIWQLLLVLVCIVIAAIAQVRGTLFLQELIDDYIVPLTQSANPDFSPLKSALINIAVVYLAGILSAYLYNRLMVTVSQGTMKKMRIQLFSHMETLPIKFFDTHSHGDVMSVYTNDIDTMRQFLSQSLPQLANSLITVLSSFISMVILNIPLTLLSIVMVTIMMSISTRIVKGAGKYFHKQQKDIGTINGYIEEMMSGQKVVKVFNHEGESIGEFRELNENLRDSADKANGYANMIMPTVAQLANVSYVLVAILGAVLALNGYAGLTVGLLVSFLSLNRNFNMPLGRISQQANSVVMAVAGMNRISDVMDETPEIDEGYVTLVNIKKNGDDMLTESDEVTHRWGWKHYHKATDTTTYVELKGDVVFEDVTFGYEDDEMVLHDIDIHAKAGQKIALVGSTGAGKTTITNLINRFYNIQDGKIRYDNININKIKKDDLRKSLALVLQDVHLFTGTVLENIRYGRLDATDEECIEAAKLANADSFITRLPTGYNTKLTGDGANLSQGQRQLLSIARAAVADAPALILDEATSSIDTRTERLVQEGMDKLMAGRTTFVIAHRLSTVRNSDLILVLEDGHIIERGNHEQLIAQKGKYYQLSAGA